MTIGNVPMVLLPLGIYKKLTKTFNKDIKKVNKSFSAVASESSLSKDWLRIEEEKAWKNL